MGPVDPDMPHTIALIFILILIFIVLIPSFPLFFPSYIF